MVMEYFRNERLFNECNDLNDLINGKRLSFEILRGVKYENIPFGRLFGYIIYFHLNINAATRLLPYTLYPSPRLIFEGTNNWSRHGAVSARTNHVLENLQRSYLQTTYQRQFTGVGPQGEQSWTTISLVTDLTLRYVRIQFMFEWNFWPVTITHKLHFGPCKVNYLFSWAPKLPQVREGASYC